MKSILKPLLVLTLVLFITGLPVAVRADDNITKNSEIIAKAFAMVKPTVRYQGWFGFDRYDGNVNIGRVEGRFSMTPDGVFTKFTVGEINLALPEGGLKAFPSNTKGKMVRFHMSADGYDEGNQSTSYSQFFTEELKAGDPIVMVMKPAYVKEFVPFTVPPGVSQENLRLVLQGKGWSVWYDSNAGGFNVWIDPISTEPLDYVITDASTGAKYQHGVLNPFGANSAPVKDSSVSFAKVGGVLELPFNPQMNGFDVSGQVLDGQVTRKCDGEAMQVAAKVLYADLSGGNLDIYDGDGGLAAGSLIEVFDLCVDGSLELVAKERIQFNNYRVSTYGIHGKVIITVTGSLQDGAKSFGLVFIRQGGARSQSTTSSVQVATP